MKRTKSVEKIAPHKGSNAEAALAGFINYTWPRFIPLIHYKMPKEDRFYEHQKAAARQLEVLYTKNKLSLHLLESPNLQEGFNNTDLDNPKQ